MPTTYIAFDLDGTLFIKCRMFMDMINYYENMSCLDRRADIKYELMANFRLVAATLGHANYDYCDHFAICPDAIAKILVACRKAGICIMFITSGGHDPKAVLPLLVSTYKLPDNFFAECIFINRAMIDEANLWHKGHTLQRLRNDNIIPPDADVVLVDDEPNHAISCAFHRIDFVTANGARMHIEPAARHDFLPLLVQMLGLNVTLTEEDLGPGCDILPYLDFRAKYAFQMVGFFESMDLFPDHETVLMQELFLGFSFHHKKFITSGIPEHFLAELKQIIENHIDPLSKFTTFFSNTRTIKNLSQCRAALFAAFIRFAPSLDAGSSLAAPRVVMC